jgi:hypothetical protein
LCGAGDGQGTVGARRRLSVCTTKLYEFVVWGLSRLSAGHFLVDGEGNLIDVSGLNIAAGSEFCAALSA